MGCGASTSSALDDAQRRIIRLEAAIADMEKKAQSNTTNSADSDDKQRAQGQAPKAATTAADAAAPASADNEHVHPFGVNQSVPVAVDSAAVAAEAARAAEFATLQNELAQLRIECASNQASNDAELKRAEAAIAALQAAAAKRNDEPLAPPPAQLSSPSVAASVGVPGVTSEEFERLEARVTTAAAAAAASEEKWQSALATETAERKREQAALQTNLTTAIEAVKDAQPKAKSPAIVIKAGAGGGTAPATAAPATAAETEAAIASARKEAADANAATGALLATRAHAVATSFAARLMCALHRTYGMPIVCVAAAQM